MQKNLTLLLKFSLYIFFFVVTLSCSKTDIVDTVETYSIIPKKSDNFYYKTSLSYPSYSSVNTEGDRLVSTDEISVSIWDISDTNNIKVIHKFSSVGAETISTTEDAILIDDYLYISDNGHKHISIWDVSTPTIPIHHTNIPNNIADPSKIDLHGNRLYIGDYVNGVVIWDVTSPNSPVYIKTLSHNNTENLSVIDNNTIYLYDFIQRKIDIMDIDTGNTTGSLSIPTEGGHIISLDFEDNYLFIARGPTSGEKYYLNIFTTDTSYSSPTSIYVKEEAINNTHYGDITYNSKHGLVFVSSLTKDIIEVYSNMEDQCIKGSTGEKVEMSFCLENP